MPEIEDTHDVCQVLNRAIYDARSSKELDEVLEAHLGPDSTWAYYLSQVETLPKWARVSVLCNLTIIHRQAQTLAEDMRNNRFGEVRHS